MNTLSISVPAAARELARHLAAHGHRAWVVGGCVRDALLGRTPHDWDLCTTARPETLLRLFPDALPTGIDHGTVTVRRDGEPYEITTLRGEGTYSDGRRPDTVVYLDDIAADLARRDFTVNAMAYDPIEGVLEDPYGGRQDLARRVIRAVGEASQRFAEDGLRVMRAARFVATLECDLHPDTEAAVAARVDSLARVSAERITAELLKALAAPRPSRALAVMARTGVLRAVGPVETVSAATAVEVDRAPADAHLRLALLCRGLEVHAVERWMRAGRHANEHVARVTSLVRDLPVAYNATWTDGDVRRWMRRVTPARVDEVLIAATAAGEVVDELASRVTAIRAAGHPLELRSLALNGAALAPALGLKPSKQLGQVLAALLEVVLEDPTLNTPEALIRIGRTLL